MSGDCFITIDEVTGEAQDKEFAGAIDVLSWEWGVNWSGNRAVVSGGRRGSADVRVFEFTHRLDNASAPLMNRCFLGTKLKKALVTMRRAGGSKAQSYLKITFSDVQVASVLAQHDADNLIPLERVTLAFEAVKFEYTMQSREGGDKNNQSFDWRLNDKP
ncbi:MAG: type VI secretion system tube protein Hcp [Burkholderiaceae bacterium]|nr:type VI secretion system tube protein Hcp [Burkholderiaceae bacterium]